MRKIHIDDDLIRHLAELLKETELSEIEVGSGRERLRISRVAGPSPTPVSVPIDSKGEVDQSNEQKPFEAPEKGAVRAPMVGTIYMAPEPGAKPFIAVGDDIREGDTLFIIEAMKTMNPVTSTRDGKVREILAKNGNPVEYDEIVALLE